MEGTAAAETSVPSRKMKAPRKKSSKKAEGPPKALSNVTDQQQKQRDKEFATHKAHIETNLQANACDLSPKGSVDVKCLPVMALLNPHPNYITTSSCSGRIALFHSIGAEDLADVGAATPSRMKRGAGTALGWVFVKHGMLRPVEMLRVVCFLCGAPSTEEAMELDAAQIDSHTARMQALCAISDASHSSSSTTTGPYDGEVGGALVASLASDATSATTLPVPTHGTLSLKMEPFVMHVECRTMESAKTLLSAAVSDSGYRNSGVIPPGRKIMCGIRSTVGLGMEVPVVLRGVNYVATQRAYVWALLELANEKMAANEAKIKLLERCVAARLDPHK